MQSDIKRLNYDKNTLKDIIRYRSDINKRRDKILMELNKKEGGRCPLCLQKMTSPHHSHSIPMMYLESVANNGKVFGRNEFIDNRNKDGIGKCQAGVFRQICTKCDNEIFQEYENDSFISNPIEPSHLNLIAIKNCLHGYDAFRKNAITSNEELKIQNRKKSRALLKDEIQLFFLMTVIYANEFELHNRIFNQRTYIPKQPYKKVVELKLPYITQIAVQDAFPIDIDENGHRIFDYIHEVYSKQTEGFEHLILPMMHICVFPNKELHETLVLVYYHYQHKIYQPIMHAMHSMSKDQQLKVVPFWILCFLENYYMHKNLYNYLKNDANVQNCLLFNTFNYMNYDHLYPEPVYIDSLPNILSYELSTDVLNK